MLLSSGLSFPRRHIIRSWLICVFKGKSGLTIWCGRPGRARNPRGCVDLAALAHAGTVFRTVHPSDVVLSLCLPEIPPLKIELDKTTRGGGMGAELNLLNNTLNIAHHRFRVPNLVTYTSLLLCAPVVPAELHAAAGIGTGSRLV